MNPAVATAPGNDVRDRGPETPHVRAGKFAVIAFELALMLVVINHFEVLSRNHLFALLCMVGGGFVVHAWLPARFRLGFFCLLSVAGILFILGWPNGVWVIGLGSGLIAVCYLPLAPHYRIALLVVAGLALAVYRSGSVAPFWPVL